MELMPHDEFRFLLTSAVYSAPPGPGGYMQHKRTTQTLIVLIQAPCFELVTAEEASRVALSNCDWFYTTESSTKSIGDISPFAYASLFALVVYRYLSICSFHLAAAA